MKVKIVSIAGGIILIAAGVAAAIISLAKMKGNFITGAAILFFAVWFVVLGLNMLFRGLFTKVRANK